MIKRIFVLVFVIFVLISCSTTNSGGDKNTNTFIRFVAREQYMKEREAKLGVFEEEESTMAFRAELAAMYDTRLRVHITIVDRQIG